MLYCKTVILAWACILTPLHTLSIPFHEFLIGTVPGPGSQTDEHLSQQLKFEDLKTSERSCLQAERAP